MARIVKSMAGRALVFVALMALALPARAGTWTFVHITDLHVGREADCIDISGDYDSHGRMLGHLLGHIARDVKPDFVIATGDLTQYGYFDDDAWMDLTSRLHGDKNNGWFIGDNIPIFFTPGNHDYRNCTQALGPVSLADYDRYIGSPGVVSLDDAHDDWYMRRHGILFFGLDSGWDETWDNPPQGTGMDLIQVNSVESIRDGSPTVIFMHHPALNLDGPNEGYFNDVGTFSSHRTTFMDDCDDGQEVPVLTGHLHQSKILWRTSDAKAKAIGDSTTLSCLVPGVCWMGSHPTVYVMTGAAMYGVYRVITVDDNGTPLTADDDTIMIGAPQTYSYLVGDVNFDGTVDFNDLAILAASYGCSEGDACYNYDVDLDSDGTVDLNDLTILGMQYGLTEP